jgi:uncharacterized protein (DUF2147 family)
MRVNWVFNFFVPLLFSAIVQKTVIVPPAERVCGKWESVEKNLRLQVFIQDHKFVAKIIWFDDGDPNDMDKWTDKHNPDPALRSRKILGLNILKDMVYHEDTNTWEDGTIYDARHGREWNASAYIDKNGLLRVKGYWHLKFIGRTMAFRRL